MKDKMKNTELNTLEKVDLNFALAKAYEDLGEIKNTFHFLKECNKLKREITNFDINFEKKTFFDIKNYFSKVNFSKFKNQSLDDKKIIIICH